MKIARYLADIVDFGGAAIEPVATASLYDFLIDRNLRDMFYYRVHWSTDRSQIDILESNGEKGVTSETSFANTITGDRLPELIAMAKSELARFK